jgi:hypothetical protein
MPFVIDFLESHDKDSIVKELKRIAALLGKQALTVKEINQHGRINSRTIGEKFGTMRKAHEAAGLIALRFTKSTDAELLRIMADLWTITLRESGRRPRVSEVQKYRFPVSSRTIVERFGTWKKAMIATAAAYPNGVPDGEPLAEPPAKVVKKRVPVSERRRFLVMRRDGYTCRLCRKPGGELEVDHMIPVCLGGSNKLENLQTLCKPCNRGKAGSLQ